MTLYYGFANGVCHHTLHLALVTYVLYSQSHDLVSSRGVFLGPTTNNIVEYHLVIGLLIEASSHGVDHIIVYLDSQLMVSQLNHVYSICNPVLLRLFRIVHFLEQSFKYITYQHVPRYFNSIVDSLANYILDWHITHS